MLNKLLTQIRDHRMVQPGDTVICAVSGGADSVALLFALYLLREKLQIRLEAAHFNHGLRGEESQRDEAFVRSLCDRYDIPLHVGSGQVVSGKKGLEAAARDARYAFFRTLPGKIATAHTADDNAETVLMHLVRGTGLKGLGAIAPVRDNLIRPMLLVTRQQVLEFLREYHLSYVEDSSNGTDDFLRNRLRHHVMPLLKQENPCLAQNLSRMAMRLRQDEEALSPGVLGEELNVEALRQLHPARRSRVLAAFLEQSGVREPEGEHIALAQSLVDSSNPSARASFPGGVILYRRYGVLTAAKDAPQLPETVLSCPGEVTVGAYRITAEEAHEIINKDNIFTVCVSGPITVRCRRSGDEIRLPGGSKKLKKLFVDRKIPQTRRMSIPVLSDEKGVLGVYDIGVNLDRQARDLPAVQLRIVKTERES